MKKRAVMKKTIKPSERDSITGFSTHFGSGRAYELKLRRRRIIFSLLAVLGVLLLIVLGYFITEVMIDFTELPVL